MLKTNENEPPTGIFKTVDRFIASQSNSHLEIYQAVIGGWVSNQKSGNETVCENQSETI